MNDTWRMMTKFTAPSIRGTERQVMERVAAIVSEYMKGEQLERLKTAVAEGTMNAIEHGNKYQPELDVTIEVHVSDEAVQVRISDQGEGQTIPEVTAPNLEAKLAGLEKPRGWGLFLIRNMADEVRVESDEKHHTLELRFNRVRSGDEQPSA
ncbi:MAG TPA: ATP-binding protein [Anaerolineaceae bacterium]|nr:ATP-binding protein [Anaerolineaceae bacterium]